MRRFRSRTRLSEGCDAALGVAQWGTTAVSKPVLGSTIPAFFVALIALGLTQPAQAQSGGPSDAAAAAFRDSTDAAPPGWTGPGFKLSHDYPKTRPNCDAPWLKRKVSFNDAKPKWEGAWADYVADIVRYVKEGQDLDLRNETSWKTEVGGQTRWYHVPWMAFDGER